jgi:hypothetical protein
MAVERHGRGMLCVNQPLAARHGRGTAWAWHAMCESAFTDTWLQGPELHSPAYNY